MINNRQAGRRNRGRNNNNGRPNGNNRGGGDNGNRIDNRSRGNAAQLLEKYKNMARDAQMVGDRVNAEYYLQFADHYFRVLADNRARQEEQQQRFRPRDENFDDDGDDFDGMDDNGDDGRSGAPSYDRGNRDQGRDQERRQDDMRAARDTTERRDDGRIGRRDRNRRERPANYQDGAAVQYEMGTEGPAGSPAEAGPAPTPVTQSPAAEAEAPRPRRGRPRKTPAPVEPGEAFDAAILPPSIGRTDEEGASTASAEEPPKKRTRRPRAAAEAAE